MTLPQIIQLLEDNQNPRGIANWEKSGVAGLRSYGLGLTQLKKLSKQVGKDQEIADQLWATDIWDAKQLACLVGVPKTLSADRLDELAGHCEHWMMGHVFAQNVMAKSPLLQDRFEVWKDAKDDGMRALGWSCLTYVAKSKKMDDAYFLPHISHIEKNLNAESNFVKDGMNNALFAMGQRSAELHEACLSAARNIGPVEVDYGDNSCQALDVVKHLSGPRIMAKFN